MSTEIFRYPTARETAVACGHRIFALLNEAREARGVATLAISGGSTPRLMFESMTGRDFDWNNVQLFWVDERMVSPEDEQSNYRMTRESLLSWIHIPAPNVHRIAGESVPDEAAAAYVAEIRQVFGLRGNELPVFDVVQRGMGPDMHTASLFPDEPLIENRTDIAAAVWVEKMKQHRVTLLRGVLERARQTLCLVSGADKAAALRSVLREPPDPMRRPSQIESPSMAWYVDEAAYGADPADPVS